MENRITRHQIIEHYPLLAYLTKIGIEPKKIGAEFKICCPFHKEKTPSCSINEKTNLFYCFGCHSSGSIIDFISKFEDISIPDAMRKLAEGMGQNSTQAKIDAASIALACQKAQGGLGQRNLPLARPGSILPLVESNTPKTIVATYDYTDETGKIVYQAVRYEPKTFSQRKPDGKGGWINSIKDVKRVLYKLPKILKTKGYIWITEGEKDADNLNSLGFTATTCVCGSKSWVNAYALTLKGKEVVICPDNDEPGQEFKQTVLTSLADYAKSVRCIKVPAPHKDVSDFIEEVGKEKAAETLHDLAKAEVGLVGGMELPVFSMEESEQEYIASIKDAQNGGILNLGLWLPSLGRAIRPLVPGEFVVLMADTGVGKTATLQSLSVNANIDTLFFELELPHSLTFERFAQIATGMRGEEIEIEYTQNRYVNWRNDPRMSKINICAKSKISVEDMEKIIVKSELKIGFKPRLVVVDYIGLLKGKGQGRYEKLSNIAEDLKVLAKTTKTIVVAATQISRKEGHEVSLHDAKDSGSIENSCGLALGMWRDPKDQTLLKIKVLKCTKGKPGTIVDCDFFGDRMEIKERPPISMSEVLGKTIKMFPDP